MYKRTSQEREGIVHCARCGAPLEGAAFVRNLQETMDELGLRYRELDRDLPAVQAARARAGLPRPREARVLVSDLSNYPIIPPGVSDFRKAGAVPAGDWRAPEPEDVRLVPTHCCYCGVQCGMYLKVDREGRVFGVEPSDHDINKGKLCPKGVTAYQQVNHPDRILHPLVRDARGQDFRRASWDESLDRVASEIQRIQATYGRDAFARVLGLVPRDREHVPDGQVRARGARHEAHRLQRATLHGERRGREQEGVRHGPRREPVAGHARRRGDAVSPARTSPSASP